ncbi:MAG: nicotinate phosphoribosyltransferase, partial [Clostridia bacterium]|nr:nicotinate phosphoribosyltransferase [Clostridia bacterium]
MRANNLTLLTDLYELTMMQGYFKNPTNQTVVFDMFYRDNPCGGGFAICAGLEQMIEYIENLRFSKEDIEYLRSLRIFEDDFLEYLSNFRFSGDIYAIPEGTVIFPREPMVKVIAPIMEAQLVETAILNIMNHQSLIATKAARVCYAAKGDGIMEFGLRRAQGPDAGIFGARAAIIGGCIGTSCVLTGQMFDVPVLGTHAHSWIMSFPDEYTAFKTYAKLYPDACILLVDTYDVLKSGVPNAIRVFEEMRQEGIPLKKYGIRIDSGDLAYLSKEAYKMLAAAGFDDATISASSDLDEYLIESLKAQDAKINSWGVGTRLITANDNPAFGGVYKLAAVKDPQTGEFIPKIKLSENTAKVTNPGNKTVYRIYGKSTGKIKADLICLADEKI